MNDETDKLDYDPAGESGTKEFENNAAHRLSHDLMEKNKAHEKRENQNGTNVYATLSKTKCMPDVSFEEKKEENVYSDFTPKSEDDLKKERRNRKRELIVGAIGDGLSSLSNLFFATKGAPVTKDVGTNHYPSLVERIQARHKSEDDKYNNSYKEWSRYNEKKRAADEKARQASEREDLHPNFKPLVKDWDDKEYVDLLYNYLLNASSQGESHANLYNFLESQKSSLSSLKSYPYFQQSFIANIINRNFEMFPEHLRDALGKEVTEDWVNNVISDWNENGFHKMK
ncbi:MAG: hypothetical protein K2M69_06005 [Muribaculaceae bacterium]|nr:hypothetical protein [Muribaculaceae bacterium]